jgi:hypothetical protein
MNFLEKPYLEGGGEATPTTIDYTPGDNDVTYTESGGILTGANGVFDGWNADNWGLVNAFTESDANDNIEFNCNISTLGQMFAYYYQNFVDVVPQFYKNVRGDFSMTVKLLSTGSDDTSRSPCLFYSVPDDGGTWNSTMSFECKGWAATTFEPTCGARQYSSGKLYTGGAVSSIWLRLSRTDSTIKMEDSADGISWNTRVSRTIGGGPVGRMGIGMGGQGGVVAKCQLEYVAASFFEAT